MKTSWIFVLSTVALANACLAQEAGVAVGGAKIGPGHPGPGQVMIYKREMGKWWQNPDVVSKLGISDSQVSQLNQVFYNHKMKLIDYGADMEKQDLKLQTLLDADQPEEGQVSSQVDQVLAARGKLEREFTMMNLDLRKQLSLEQWRQLKTMQGGQGPGNKFFMRFKTGGPGGPGGPDDMPPLPPPPGLE
jgi:periplasmic protein CpxP/Spy